MTEQVNAGVWGLKGECGRKTVTIPHIDPTAVIGAVAGAGFNTGLAIATDAEIAAGAACGQMALLVEDLEAIKKELEGCGAAAMYGDDVPVEFEVCDESGWDAEYKGQTKHIVYKHAPTGTFWMACGSRYGDHWQGYETSLDAVEQVRSVETTITTWEGV